MGANNYNWNLRMAIYAKGYTYRSLAEKCGLHYVKICRIVTGEAVPKQSERVILSRILREPQKKLFREHAEVPFYRH